MKVLCIGLLALGATACPTEPECSSDLDCPAGNVCGEDGVCEEGGTSPEPEAPETELPDTILDDAPSPLSNDPNPSFAFSCDRSTCSFECSLDAAPFSSCRSPVEESSLDDGDHSFAVRAITGALVDATPAQADFTIDTTAPVLVVTSQPPALTREADATVEMTCDADCTLTCALDGAAAQPCTSPLDVSNLDDGIHSLQIRAVDSATNSAQETIEWTIDSLAPQLTVVAPSPSPTGPSTEVSFSSPDAISFSCSLDGEAFAACFSPAVLENLDDGPHTFAVTATDTAGNTSAEEQATWDVDAVAPSVVVDTGPVNPSTRVNETLFFSCSEQGCAFECALDDEAFAGCVSPLQLTDLDVGDHALQIRARDPVGNTGTPVTLTWTINRTFVAMSHNGGSHCAIANDGTLWCWGNGSAIGQQPNLDDPPVFIDDPLQIGDRRDWADVDMNLHTCALSRDGELACFGTNAGGPHGLGDTTYREVPEGIPALVVTSFSAGFLRTCAVANGDVYCWGANNYGNVLGLGDFAGELKVPNLVEGSATFNAERVFMTNDHSFSVSQTGALYRWGGPGGGPVTNDIPTLDDGGPIGDVNGGTFVACYEKTGDGFYCGDNNAAPAFVDTDENWLAMSGSTDNVCGIRLDRTVQCWPEASFAGRVDRGLVGIVELESFDGSFCALDAIGALHCFSTPTGPITTTAAPQTAAR